MNVWLIGFETVVIGVVVIIVALSWMQHREKLARLEMDAWHETLKLPPGSIFTKSSVHPIPRLVGERANVGRMKFYGDIGQVPPAEDDEPEESPEPRPAVQ